MFSKIKDKYKNFDVIILSGGPSSLKYLKQLKEINNRKIKIIVEAKAITPELIKSKIKIDYILCPFPEKMSDNAFHTYLLRSFCSKIDIKFFIKKKFYKELNTIIKNFNNIYEIWNPKKGQHKYYKIKESFYFKDSPLDLIKKIKNVKIISDPSVIKKIFKGKIKKKNIFNIKIKSNSKNYSFEKYCNPKIVKNTLELDTFRNFNTLFIATIPILKQMGFKRIYLLGFDMNFMGSMEYSAKNIFKSFVHFLIFLIFSRKSFGANLKLNFPFIHLRPKSEFKDLSTMFDLIDKKIYNINNFSFFNGSVKNLPEIRYEKFFKDLLDEEK